jgi:hypothetical protein
MLSFIVILILVVGLIASIVGNILLYKAGVRWLNINEMYEQRLQRYETWVDEFKELAVSTYAHMKLIDDKQMFEKDDDVGVIFQEMLNLLKVLNDKTQDTTEE